MESLATLIARLRKARGLSQSALARASGLAVPTIVKLEGGGNLRGESLAMIYRGLNAHGPLSEADAGTFRSVSGLPGLPAPSSTVDPRHTTARALDLRAYVATLPRDEARCYTLLEEMLEVEGPVNVLRALEAFAHIAGISIATDHPRVFTRVDPPRARPDLGAVEQVFTEFEVRTEPPIVEKPRRKKA